MYKKKQNKSCNLQFLKYKLSKILNIVKCSRNFEFEKGTDQNFITQNLCHVKDYCIFEEKRNCENQYRKEVIYGYTLAFAGWWSILWVVVGSGGYILSGGG